MPAVTFQPFLSFRPFGSVLISGFTETELPLGIRKKLTGVESGKQGKKRLIIYNVFKKLYLIEIFNMKDITLYHVADNPVSENIIVSTYFPVEKTVCTTG